MARLRSESCRVQACRAWRESDEKRREQGMRCACGAERETAKHWVMECRLHDEHRTSAFALMQLARTKENKEQPPPFTIRTLLNSQEAQSVVIKMERIFVDRFVVPTKGGRG